MFLFFRHKTFCNLYIVAIIFCFSLCHSNPENNQDSIKEKKGISDSSVEILNSNQVDFKLKIFQNSDSSFGYSVAKNNKNFILQKTIPAITGNKGFINKHEAEKCGLLIVEKLKKNIWPPTISLNEIDSLRISY